MHETDDEKPSQWIIKNSGSRTHSSLKLRDLGFTGVHVWNNLHTFSGLMPCVQGTTLYPTSTNGIITSMNYPNNFINNANCGFLITASSPFTVRKHSIVIYSWIPDWESFSQQMKLLLKLNLPRGCQETDFQKRVKPISNSHAGSETQWYRGFEIESDWVQRQQMFSVEVAAQPSTFLIAKRPNKC
jgi:hypothetical protein